MKVMGLLTRIVLAAVFTTGVILMGASTTLMAASPKEQKAWVHYQTRHYKGGSRTEWYLGGFTDPSTGKARWLLKMDFYDAKGNLKKTEIGLIGAKGKYGDTRRADWDRFVKLLKQKGGKVKITPEFAKTPLGKFIATEAAGLVTVIQPSDDDKALAPPIR